MPRAALAGVAMEGVLAAPGLLTRAEVERCRDEAHRLAGAVARAPDAHARRAARPHAGRGARVGSAEARADALRRRARVRGARAAPERYEPERAAAAHALLHLRRAARRRRIWALPG